jgi:hypothetical protein
MLLLPAEPQRVAGPINPLQALTNQAGVYVFDGIAAGRYRLQAEKAGFVTSSDAAVINVAARQAITRPDLRLARAGAIGGRVLDGQGEPLPEVMVTAVRPPSGSGPAIAEARRNFNGQRIPVGQAGQTNDLGEFRISGLPAGEYYVAADPRPRPMFMQTSDSGGTTLVRTYYPGALDVSGAQTITIAAGQTVSVLEFTMLSVPAFDVSGFVVDEMDRPIGGAMVMLTPDGPEPLGTGGSARTQPDGTFRLGNITRGAYRLTAVVPITVSSREGSVPSGGVIGGFVWGTGSGVPPQGGIAARSGTVQVIVEGADVVGVKVIVP